MTASMAATDSPVLTSALRWARDGIRVFPIKPGTKKPAHEGWQEEATTDEATIRKWSLENLKWNYGLVMGEPLPSGGFLVAVDVDMKLDREGKLLKNGEVSLQTLCQETGLDPSAMRTRMQHTPSGQRDGGKHEGGHLLFTTVRPVSGGADKLGLGVDVKGSGGYIVGAGSSFEGKTYEIVDWDAPILPLPEVIEARLEAAHKKREKDPAPLPGIDPERAKKRAIEFLKTASGVSEGSRGSTAYKIAARLKELGCDRDDTLLLMDLYWAPRCEPPMPDEDLEDSVDHAYIYGQEPQGSAAPEAVFEVVSHPPSGAPPKSKGAPLEVHRWNEYKNLSVPPVQWIWDPFFPRVPFGILASHSGHGKSWLALQIAVATATGLPLFGRATCGPAGAGMLALEDDWNVIHRRILAIREAYGFAWKPDHDDLLDKNFVPMNRGPVQDHDEAAEAHELRKLAPAIKAAMDGTRDKPAVLFIDTLNAVYPGEENDNTAARMLAAEIFSLHDATGCSVWALHHLKKGGNGKLTERLDPELARGASAIVASCRALVQFGWILPGEAVKADLDPEDCHRRYAIMALSKINDGPRSYWELLEHSDRGGLWIQTPNGESALASLRGGTAPQKLRKSEAILMDLYEAREKADGRDLRKDLIERHFPGDARGAQNLSAVLCDLRKKNRGGFVVPGHGLELTEAGMKKALELKSRHAPNSCLDDGPEYSETQDSSIFD